MDHLPHDSLTGKEKDALVRFLERLVLLAVRALAVLIIFVLGWGMVDVVVHIFKQIWESPVGVFDAETLIGTLGSFLAVLIVIEIFISIIFYLKKDAIHVPLMVSTALTAVARKVIIIDYSTVSPFILYGVAALILSLGTVLWLVTKKEE